jgi:LacI family transcriptional regulator
MCSAKNRQRAGRKGGTRPTLADVARDSGVSKSAASMALSSSSDEECPLLPETRARIIASARKLGYRRNWRGSALAHNATRMIGWVTTSPMPYMGRVYADMSMAFAERLWEDRYHLTFVPVTDDTTAWHDPLLDGRLDGCIVIDHAPDKVYPILESAGIPVVFMNATTDRAFSQILADDRQGMSLAVKHLRELGHERIWFYHGSLKDGGERRRRAPHYSRVWREETYGREMGSAGAKALWGEPSDVLDRIGSRSGPTAVVAYSDDEALALLQQMWERRLRVPDDLSIVAFNDVHPVANLGPPLTVVRVPSWEIGRTGAEVLLGTIAGEIDGAQTVVLPEKLVVRRSTAEVVSSE